MYLFERAPADESSAAVVKSGIKVRGVMSKEYVDRASVFEKSFT
jgi:hypothetical protein